MNIEKNNIEVPLHLDEKFFKHTLENGLRNNKICIESVSFEMGSSTGDNYCSQIYRVRINYKTTKNSKSSNVNNKSISIIIKSIPINSSNDFLDDANVFMKEKIMYNDVIPKIEFLISNNTIFGAKYFNAVSDPIQTIVVEDLCSHGYQIGNRQQGLDEEHSKLVLTKLAKYHAASMVLAKKDPNLIEHFGHGMFAPGLVNHPVFKNFFYDNMNYFWNEVSNWSGYETITNKLKNINENLREKCLNMVKPSHGEIKVLNHGDLWVNNIMFKYADSNEMKSHPIDVVFIDFQMSFYASLGIDLNYFFITSVQLDVLINKREELIQIYYQVLESTLRELHYESVIPTYEDVRREVKEREFYGLVTGVALLPLLAIDKENSQDCSIETFQNKEFAEKKRSLMFSSKRCQDTFRFTLKRLNELGVLD